MVYFHPPVSLQSGKPQVLENQAILMPQKTLHSTSLLCMFSYQHEALPPTEGEKQPPRAAGSGQDGAHRSPEMAVPRLCPRVAGRGAVGLLPCALPAAGTR